MNDGRWGTIGSVVRHLHPNRKFGTRSKRPQPAFRHSWQTSTLAGFAVLPDLLGIFWSSASEARHSDPSLSLTHSETAGPTSSDLTFSTIRTRMESIRS